MSIGAAADATNKIKTKAVSACPQCGAKGRKVGALTMRSLLFTEALNHFDKSDSFLFCKTEACEVVYFGARRGEPFREAELRVPVFQKSADPLRLVCYCFGHTVKAVRDDALRSDTASIADDITDKCRQGLDRCEETNPQGSCCLGNVRQVAKAALADAETAPNTQETSTEELPACCCTKQGSAPEIGDDNE